MNAAGRGVPGFGNGRAAFTAAAAACATWVLTLSATAVQATVPSSAKRSTISAMAGRAGTDRWVMTGGIVLVAGCYLVTAAGLTGLRASARALLAVAGMAGLGIAVSPEPARGATPRHLAWTVLGAVTIAVWPAFAARRAPPRPLILSVYGSAAVTAVFVALLGWLLAETRDGSVLGLAERLTTSTQTSWPFITAVALRRTRRPPVIWSPGGAGAPGSGRANHHDPVASANLPGGHADSDPSRQAIQLTGASPSGSAARATPDRREILREHRAGREPRRDPAAVSLPRRPRC